jgi:hypothetical protein
MAVSRMLALSTVQNSFAVVVSALVYPRLLVHVLYVTTITPKKLLVKWFFIPSTGDIF